MDDPLSLNEYVYGGNNPINRVDPNGDRWYIPNPFRAVVNFIADQLIDRGYGEAILYMSDNSRFWRTAMDHPYVVGAAIGVVAGIAAVARVVTNVVTSVSERVAIRTVGEEAPKNLLKQSNSQLIKQIKSQTKVIAER